MDRGRQGGREGRKGNFLLNVTSNFPSLLRLQMRGSR